MSKFSTAALIAASVLSLSAPVNARSGGSHSSGVTHHSSGSHSTTHSNYVPKQPALHKASSGSHSTTHHPKAVDGVKRDANGKIARSGAAKEQFKKSQPCPSTGKSSGACPGYVIDHVQPLKRGGADHPSNMQWQTTREAKAKDKVE